MNRLVYTSLSALRGAMARQASTANNLANANTVGFRAEIANQRPLWIEGQGFDARALASEEVLAADMSEGTVSETGRALDIAMEGDALLAVQADNGEEAYTRRGDRSEEHTSELQSLMRISYAVFCLKKKNDKEPRSSSNST